MMRFHVMLAAGLLAAGAAMAQDVPVAPADKNAPLVITADQTLEWHRNNQQYIARGNAMAEQDGVSIKAQTLTADYADTQKSSMDIQKLTAIDEVTISSQGNVATGQKAVYDVTTGIATMTGNNLNLTSPDQTVTARDQFVYDVKAGRLSAHGNAVVTRLQDKLTADVVSAVFADDKATGKRALKELTADGNVVIVTPTETVRGKKGVYRADTNIATLKGGVRIERGPNVLEGDEAEVNLTTNVSRMIGGATTEGGRVRGVFYPGSSDSARITPVPATTQAPAPIAAPVTTPATTPMTAPVTTPVTTPMIPVPEAMPKAATPPAQEPIRLTPPRSKVNP